MTGVLTMGLVMQRSKIDDIQRVQKLNVCNSQLQDIGVLRDALSLEVLSLSLNDLEELGALSNCSRLHELHLRRNQIRDINQVLHLKHLPLDVLNLAENPICRDPNYRRFIIAAIPSLERLDDTNISDDERAGALRVFPELSSFAPPPSRYANNGENTGYVPAPKPAASVRPSTQQQRPSTAGSQRPSSAGIPPTPNRRPESRPASSNYGGATPSNANANRLRSSGSMSVGPSEAGVVQAVKVLCSELSPQALQEVRRFLDSLNGY